MRAPSLNFRDLRPDDEINYRLEPQPSPPAVSGDTIHLAVIERWLANPDLTKADVLDLVRAARKHIK